MDEEGLMAAVARRARDPSTRTDMAKTSPTEIHKRATPVSVAAAERDLGFALPHLLRRVLCEIGNGGFGPAYGLLGLADGYADEHGDTVVSSYLNRLAWKTEDVGSFHWPENWLVICTWGCAIYSCIDCSKDAAPVITCDPSDDNDDEELLSFAKSHDSLEQWLHDWAEGKKLWDIMYERMPPTMSINPFTKEPIELARFRLRGQRLSARWQPRS